MQLFEGSWVASIVLFCETEELAPGSRYLHEGHSVQLLVSHCALGS